MTIIKLGYGIDLEIDIDIPVEENHSDRRLLLRILAELKHQQNQLKEIRKHMVTPESLALTTKAITDAVTGAIANIPVGNPASTPDNVVLAFQSSVQAQADRLNQAENAGGNPPPPPIADWQPNTVYAAGAQVRNPADGLSYTSNVDQTSGSTFDPNLWTPVSVLARRRR